MDLNTSSYPWLNARTILLVRAGSHAYGTNVAGSDEDIRGITVPPVEYLLGYSRRFEQATMKTPDVVIYGIQRFFELLAKGSCNHIEMLYTEPTDRLFTHPLAEELIVNRDSFTTMRTAYSYIGQASGLWSEWSKDLQPKKAMHMVRCFRIAKALLEGNPLEVRRMDAAELVGIRQGKWSEKEISEYAYQADREISEKLASLDGSKKYPLAESVDSRVLDWFCVSLIEGSFEFLVNMPVFGEWKQEPLGFTFGSLKDKWIGWENK
jgi:predicted nucleotidyltransferase